MEQDPMIVNQYLLYNQEFIGTEPRTGIVLPVIDFELPTKKQNEGELLPYTGIHSWDSEP
jgi:hypothetical protein